MDIQAVGAVITDSQGRVLLVLRKNEPAAGRWSLPGGRVEAGETPEAAVVREVHEETGLTVLVGRRLAQVTIPIDDKDSFVVNDYRCGTVDGKPAAADDAAEARWVALGELDSIETSDDLAVHLRRWLLPARRDSGH